MSEVPRPRRSVLYLPASSTRALEKAKSLTVDALIFDLEDAVGPDHKQSARQNACAAARSGEYGHREVAIRVNGAGTQWHDDDLAAVCEAGPDAVVVPKVDSADAVREVVAAMERHGVPDHTRIWAMVETPTAVLEVAAIASASDRLAVLVVGSNDLAKELGVRQVPGRAPLLTSLALTVLAARHAGIAVLDGVWNDVRDLEGFEAECHQGRDLGFDGKTLVHPGQVDPCNAVFAPSPEEVEQARGVLQAWEGADGAGVVVHEGRMVEALHVESARKVLATHEAVSRRG